MRPEEQDTTAGAAGSGARDEAPEPATPQQAEQEPDQATRRAEEEGLGAGDPDEAMAEEDGTAAGLAAGPDGHGGTASG